MTQAQSPLSVSDAVCLAKANVAQWPSLVVNGEVSGFRGPNARSGHCYFEVKDEDAAMSVIVWRGVAQHLGFQLRNGLAVQLTGRFDVYKGSGKLSFVASRVEPVGEGLLRQQVAELARRLQAEGLTDDARKRPVPAFCSRVCVVTSLSGSVIEDVKRTLARRNPLVAIDVVGASVQGADAPATIVRALRVADASGADAILLVRGGGSFEDLMCFNDESVARAIVACRTPVVTGIGHEPDTSIADMVADRRASTPTAAAESVAPAIGDVERQMTQRQVRLGRAMKVCADSRSQRLDALSRLAGRAMRTQLVSLGMRLDSLASRRCLQDPLAPIEDRAQDLEQTSQRLHDALPRTLSRRSADLSGLGERLHKAGPRSVEPARAQVARLAATLDALSPLKVLGRGYSIARRPDGSVVSDAAQVAPGDQLDLLLGEGSVEATVTATNDTHSA